MDLVQAQTAAAFGIAAQEACCRPGSTEPQDAMVGDRGRDSRATRFRGGSDNATVECWEMIHEYAGRATPKFQSKVGANIDRSAIIGPVKLSGTVSLFFRCIEKVPSSG